MLNIDYERGLENLHDIVQRQEPGAFSEFAVFQFQLLECLRDEKYGYDPTNKARQSRVLEQLNRFTLDHFGIPFIDFCRSDRRTDAPSLERNAQEPTVNLLQGVWEGGDEIIVKGSKYIIHEPIEKQWSSDQSALQQQARALQVDTGRMTWLKQIQVYRATDTANAWKTALEKEMRLLNDLTPHLLLGLAYLDFESTIGSVTLVYSAVSGESWSQYFKLLGQPLDKRSTRTLLSSAISLCETLKPLHAKKLAHRSLTPDKIFLTGGRTALLQDLGLTTRRYERGEGPELYRAPEQTGAQIRPPDPRTDIYQLGMILNHFITGTMPKSPQQVLPLRTWNSELSEELDAVLQRAIAFRLDERWRNAADFSSALKRVL
jgi:Protein kinase domain